MSRRFRRLSGDESGYSLIEVMTAITILMIAIIPMIGMFDMGLTSATAGSDYDKARALAGSNLEKVRSLPYSTARVSYRPVNALPTPGTPVSCDQGKFDCEVTTTYVNGSFAASSGSTTRMSVVVTVRWDGATKAYTTSGLKAQ